MTKTLFLLLEWNENCYMAFVGENFVSNIFYLQVVLPEGSKEISVSVPFSTKQWQEVWCFYQSFIQCSGYFILNITNCLL